MLRSSQGVLTIENMFLKEDGDTLPPFVTIVYNYGRVRSKDGVYGEILTVSGPEDKMLLWMKQESVIVLDSSASIPTLVAATPEMVIYDLRS